MGFRNSIIIFIIKNFKFYWFLCKRNKERKNEFINQAPLKNNSVEINEDTQIVWEAVNQLNKKYKSTIMLVYDKELNHKETAQILHCSETTVSWRIFQAKKMLKKILMKELS